MPVRRSAALFADVATLQAEPGHRVEHYAVVLANGHLYRWVPDSAVAADGYSVISHNAGYPGRWLLVAGDRKGADLGNADATIAVAGKLIRYLPATTLSANRVLTVDDEGAQVGTELTIVRLDATANTYRIDNGGPLGGTLHTLPVSQRAWVTIRFDGANWQPFSGALLPA